MNKDKVLADYPNAVAEQAVNGRWQINTVPGSKVPQDALPSSGETPEEAWASAAEYLCL